MRAIKEFVYRNWQRVHGVRRLEIAVLTRYLELDGGRRILDVGSGKGAFRGALARAGHEAVGVDPSPAAVAIAKSYVNPRGLFVLGAGESAPFSPGASIGPFPSACSSTRETTRKSCVKSTGS